MSWQSHFLEQGLYGDLKALFPGLAAFADFPSPAELQRWLAADTRTCSGKTIQFCAGPADEYYEAQVLETGRVPTRERNWHDLFNALAWALFPNTKAQLNALHVADIKAHGLHPRTLRRDSLTLFDECGVLVVATDKTLLDDLRQHQWQRAFVANRERWGQSIGGYVFGHAVYEQGLTPYLGLTAKMFPLVVSDDFFALPLAARYQYLDKVLCQVLKAGALDNKKRLSPLPLLGVPFWWPDNQNPAFYDNVQYFRPLTTPRPPL
ncbi:DUF3025 domain-containing protein [Gallaecimonas mangrovi]|uniref:DUF3025 domain-containing protein n=1 Tax=Gallaecimonas mangrovi TaxID=2291597 RepID=UPI001D009D36|nr:DUF3025 domain-containing protein [Gallaecimonas mangrovi]